VTRTLPARYRGGHDHRRGLPSDLRRTGASGEVRPGVCEAVKPLGLEVRAGCHTGEIELLGADVGGIAVHICARVSALAGPSEVLVSSTVKDLVAGSGLVFEDRGERTLKSVPEKWRLYAVMG
jgi:class 3 adenylate cyclase